MASVTRSPNEAATWLKQGGLVAIPTETVYGLAADAFNPHAIETLYRAKGRPANHPVIIHCATLQQVETLVSEFPTPARMLAEAFWPGPLTLVLPKTAMISPAITGGQFTVAVRIPNHPLTLNMLEIFNNPIVAPSANRFGGLSPTCAQHVQADLGDAIDGILDGGPCSVGIESTIIGFQNDAPVLLRPGMITPEQIQARCQMTVLENAEKAMPVVSGGLPSHYAPKTPLYLIEASRINEVLWKMKSAPSRLAWLSHVNLPELDKLNHVVLLPNGAESYAKMLYKALHSLDGLGYKAIYVITPPKDSVWQAIHDRLTRAASPINQEKGILHV